MENQTCEQPSAEDLVGLGVVLGQNQTFGLLAGRCSAAQAETIRRLRVEKIVVGAGGAPGVEPAEFG